MEKYAAYKKKRIGYTDVHETVKTIEKIAAAHLHEIDKRTGALAKHTENIVAMLTRLQEFTDEPIVSKTVPKTNKSLLVLVTGDKGLVGDAWQRLFSVYEDMSHQDVIVLGKKGQTEVPVSSPYVQHRSFLSRLPSPEEISALSELLHSYIKDGIYDSVVTLHLSAASVVDLRPVEKQLLPLVIEEPVGDLKQKFPIGFPIIEGEISTLQERLFEKYMNTRLEYIVLETAVAEYSARTIAMEHAAAKTEEMLTRLSRVYLRDRRHLETQKQLERFAANKISV